MFRSTSCLKLSCGETALSCDLVSWFLLPSVSFKRGTTLSLQLRSVVTTGVLDPKISLKLLPELAEGVPLLLMCVYTRPGSSLSVEPTPPPPPPAVAVVVVVEQLGGALVPEHEEAAGETLREREGDLRTREDMQRSCDTLANLKVNEVNLDRKRHRTNKLKK